MGHANTFKGKRLYDLRTALKLTRLELEREIFRKYEFVLTQWSIRHIETERHSPNDNQKEILEKFFEVPKDYFRKRNEEI